MIDIKQFREELAPILVNQVLGRNIGSKEEPLRVAQALRRGARTHEAIAALRETRDDLQELRDLISDDQSSLTAKIDRSSKRLEARLDELKTDIEDLQEGGNPEPEQ